MSITPPAKLASLTYGLNGGADGWTNILMSWIDPLKGTLQAANYVQQRAYTVAAPVLAASPQGVVEAGFSVVAMTQSMKVFLLSPSMGQIHEYSVNTTSAFTWTWQTAVPM